MRSRTSCWLQFRCANTFCQQPLQYRIPIHYVSLTSDSGFHKLYRLDSRGSIKPYQKESNRRWRRKCAQGARVKHPLIGWSVDARDFNWTSCAERSESSDERTKRLASRLSINHLQDNRTIRLTRQRLRAPPCSRINQLTALQIVSPFCWSTKDRSLFDVEYFCVSRIVEYSEDRQRYEANVQPDQFSTVSHFYMSV